MKTILALAIFFTAWLAPAQVTVIKAGRLIDPDSGAVLTDQKILIVGSKIAAVGKEAFKTLAALRPVRRRSTRVMRDHRGPAQVPAVAACSSR